MILALVFVAVLNSWQIWRLNREVSSLREKIAVMKVRRAPAQSNASRSALDRAYRHLSAAREAIAKGDVKRGSAELDKSVRLAEKAYEDAATPYTKAAQRFQQTLKNTHDAIQKLQSSLQEKPHTSQGGSRK